MVVPIQTPAMAEALAAYPPPYRFTANVGWFPATGDAGVVAAALERNVVAFRGRALLAVIAAEYTAIRCGPGSALAIDGEGRPYRYREVAWLGINPFGVRQQIRFGQLCVDAPTPLPMALGDSYGFPKASASVAIGGRSASAGTAPGPRVALAWRRVCGIPATLVRLSPGAVVSFAKTGVLATMGVTSARSASVVRVTEWDTSLAGVDLRSIGWGVTLSDAEIHLGAPRP
ncbi:MAG: hypothetical protein EXR52_04245 [Dehalococcoidia bacterium]|nr:hypothetical protein [Dehalococcoidia bacterium]